MQGTMACLNFLFLFTRRTSTGAQHAHSQTHTNRGIERCSRPGAPSGAGKPLTRRRSFKNTQKIKQKKTKQKRRAYSSKKQTISIETIRDTAKAGRDGQAQDGLWVSEAELKVNQLAAAVSQDTGQSPAYPPRCRRKEGKHGFTHAH